MGHSPLCCRRCTDQLCSRNHVTAQMPLSCEPVLKRIKIRRSCELFLKCIKIRRADSRINFKWVVHRCSRVSSSYTGNRVLIFSWCLCGDDTLMYQQHQLRYNVYISDISEQFLCNRKYVLRLDNNVSCAIPRVTVAVSSMLM